MCVGPECKPLHCVIDMWACLSFEMFPSKTKNSSESTTHLKLTLGASTQALKPRHPTLNSDARHAIGN